MNTKSINQELIGTVAWAGIIGIVALGAIVTHKLGYIGGEMVTRAVIGTSGLMFAWYGNRIPKRIASNASARRAQRVAAWSLVLSSLLYAGLWAFAPILVAAWAGSGAVLAGVALTFGYCAWLDRTKAA